jgi:hypothetical protein
MIPKDQRAQRVNAVNMIKQATPIICNQGLINVIKVQKRDGTNCTISTTATIEIIHTGRNADRFCVAGAFKRL